MKYAFLLASMALYAAGTWMDTTFSAGGHMFGATETTGFLKGAWNRIDTGRKWMLNIAFAALFLGLFLFGGGYGRYAGIAGFALLGIASVLIALDNRKLYRKSREKQIGLLTEWRKYDPEMAEEMNQQMMFNDAGALKRTDGVFYYSLFPWVVGDTPEDLRRKLVQHAHRAPSAWFVEGV